MSTKDNIYSENKSTVDDNEAVDIIPLNKLFVYIESLTWEIKYKIVKHL